MTESTKTVKEVVQGLMDSFTQLGLEAEQRRATAGNKFEYYKSEFADGEKHANEEAAKKLKVILDKM